MAGILHTRSLRASLVALAILTVGLMVLVSVEAYTADRAYSAFLTAARGIHVGATERELETLDDSLAWPYRTVTVQQYEGCESAGGKRVRIYAHEYGGAFSQLLRRRKTGRDELWVCLDSGRVVKTSHVLFQY